MDKRTKKAIQTFLLSTVWVGVVVGSVFLAVTRREEYGLVACIAPVMALFMLIIFVVSFLPRRIQKGKASEFLGKLSTAALILCALAVLGYSVVVSRKSLGTLLIVGLFFVIFVRIFIDFIKDWINPKKKPNKRKASHKAPAPESSDDPDGRST